MGEFYDNQFSSAPEDNLNIVLKAYLKGFACGEKHIEDSDRFACARSTQHALQNSGKVHRSALLRDMIEDLLKARVHMRKALRFQQKKKNYFELARELLKDDYDKAAAETPLGAVKRTPWQRFLHMGAPGSELTREIKAYKNAQLVTLPLLTILANMSNEWKSAYGDIVNTVSSLKLRLGKSPG